MEAIDLLLNRRSHAVPTMVAPGPSGEDLDKICAAGIRVPDHGKLFPWRIQILDGAGQAALGEVCATAFAAKSPDASPEAIECERQRPQLSPTLLVVTNRIDQTSRVPETDQYRSGGAVCQNLLNAAHALGYVAKWLTEWPVRHEGVKRVLGHDPTHDMIGWIHIGSASTAPTTRKRATVADVVSEWPTNAPQS